MDIFQRALINKLRFESVRGEITTEQLFDLPLQSKTGFDLDSVAKNANQRLKAVTEESFVTATSSPGKSMAELRLDVVKAVIQYRIDENRKRLDAAQRAAQREKLEAVLGRKQDEELDKLSPAEIQARLDALDGK